MSLPDPPGGGCVDIDRKRIQFITWILDINTDEKRRFKDEIYEQFARIGKALSSPPRLELIDLLAQGERAVEELAEETGMSTANTSRHLQVLRRARLVRRRKEGNRAFYSLSGPDVFSAWR
ncbi:MAG: ArsR/SmtB family transcription factor, partial [Gemmatimonadota bacterium]